MFEVGLYAPRFDGCVYGQTHRYGLGEGTSIGGEGSDHYTLAGTTVAFVEHCRGSGTGGCASGTNVRVVNLRSGKTLYSTEVGDYKCGGGQVLSLVLKEDGSVAWTELDQVCRGTPSPDVWLLDPAGDRAVDNGSGIDPNSLALAGSTVYWMQEGQPHSAPLH